jgi:hypothetical protein
MHILLQLHILLTCLHAVLKHAYHVSVRHPGGWKVGSRFGRHRQGVAAPVLQLRLTSWTALLCMPAASCL